MLFASTNLKISKSATIKSPKSSKKIIQDCTTIIFGHLNKRKHSMHMKEFVNPNTFTVIYEVCKLSNEFGSIVFVLATLERWGLRGW